MKTIITLFLIFLSSLGFAQTDEHYLNPGKVVLEHPLEEDVIKVNIALGYCTVLEFPEKPTIVTVGDNSLIQVEIPKNSKNVVIKPLQASGETNLFVFTSGQRFNYKVIIGTSENVDYVLDSQGMIKSQAGNKGAKPSDTLTLDKILKMARSYGFLKINHLVDDRVFIRKKLSFRCSYPVGDIDVVEAFTNRKPNYLILHVLISNQSSDDINLNEQKTDILVKGKRLTPQYVLFDKDHLAQSEQTDGWLVLEDKYISVDNKFSVSLGIGDEEYVCKQSIF